jgi:hypothetical protein
MNNENYANRIKIDGAKPAIFVINASQNLNSDIAQSFRNVLVNKQIDFLVNLNIAKEELFPNIKIYNDTMDMSTQLFYENPFLETQLLINETAELVYEKKEQTGVTVVKEQSGNTKDRYTSVSYGSYFASLLEQDLLSDNTHKIDISSTPSCVSTISFDF